jgi:thioredoxin
MGDIFEIHPGEFEEKVLRASSERPVIVDFWAEWCAPCMMLGPILEQVTTQYEVSLAKVNVDENRELAATYKITSIPSVKIFREGKIAGEFVGVKPESEVKRILSEVISE